MSHRVFLFRQVKILRAFPNFDGMVLGLVVQKLSESLGYFMEFKRFWETLQKSD